jgi:carboxylate-amine ligase
VVRLRLATAQAAERAGARLVATGMPPYRSGALGQVTPYSRYLELARRFPHAAPSGGACACQVYVGVPDRDLAAGVVTRLRPWLATLLAMTVNSPIAAGADTGWSSRRYAALLRWPTFLPPQAWAGADRYDRTVRSLVANGSALDTSGVYFLARLSPHHPTVEVRVADTCLTADDTLLLAALVRGLVEALLDDVRRARPVEPAAPAGINAGLLAAAYHGMPPAADAPLARLYEKVMPALEESGDAEVVTAGLERLRRVGTGAARQRLLWERAATPRDFVASVAGATVQVAESPTAR